MQGAQTIDERRQRRSAYVPNAVRYQLEYVREALGLDAIVLADDLGIAIAAAGPSELTELLADSALWSPAPDGALDPWARDALRTRFPRLRDHEIVAMGLNLPNLPSWRLITAGRSCARYVGLEHAARGIRRILDEAARGRAAEEVLAEAS